MAVNNNNNNTWIRLLKKRETYQNSLASTLDSIQTEEKRPICMSRLVFLEPVQQERNAVLRLVVNDFRHG